MACPECPIADLIAELARLKGTTEAVERTAHGLQEIPRA